MQRTNVSTRVECGDRTFVLQSGAHEITVYQTGERTLTIPCPSEFTHGDLPAFARGWTYCTIYG